MPEVVRNPAEEAAERAWEQLRAKLDASQSFVFEAGAGAGKTYSLGQTLDYLIARDARALLRRKQQIACITFTNVARDTIIARTDRNPVVFCETTHAFAWDIIRHFPKQVREAVPTLDAWQERLADIGDLDSLAPEYELGRRGVEDGRLLLHHDDIFPILTRLLENAKFRVALTSRFPVILIDEYQDTNTVLIEAFEKHFFGKPGAPQFGFYGDHWQKIYGEGCGSIDNAALGRVEKGANFRSVKLVVDALNEIRPELRQVERDPDAPGMLRIWHTNGWRGVRQTQNHWQGDLPADEARRAFVHVRDALIEEGWAFTAEHTKVLMLTQRALANELGYGSLPGIFRFNDSFSSKSDPHIAFLVDTLEPAAEAFAARRFGAMFEALGRRAPPVRGAADKLRWSATMNRILEIRQDGTVGDMMGHLLETGLPELPSDVARAEQRLVEPVPEGEEVPRRLIELAALKEVAFTEISELARYHAGTSPFETKHGVKGAQFENVLGVFGRGWNQYNFDEYLRLARNPAAIGARQAAFERARNLFYVVCSRPKKRLSLLFTQELSRESLDNLATFFGVENIRDIGGLL